MILVRQNLVLVLTVFSVFTISSFAKLPAFAIPGGGMQMGSCAGGCVASANTSTTTGSVAASNTMTQMSLTFSQAMLPTLPISTSCVMSYRFNRRMTNLPKLMSRVKANNDVLVGGITAATAEETRYLDEGARAILPALVSALKLGSKAEALGPNACYPARENPCNLQSDLAETNELAQLYDINPKDRTPASIKKMKLNKLAADYMLSLTLACYGLLYKDGKVILSLAAARAIDKHNLFYNALYDEIDDLRARPRSSVRDARLRRLVNLLKNPDLKQTSQWLSMLGSKVMQTGGN